ncbi:MAG: S9 family peptidase [Kineosporiaceae bacterium]|nr:S9 family peptidase [Kineosporiaceae bacterium]
MTCVSVPHGYPPATRLDIIDLLHGHRVADPYRWLEDGAHEDTRAWSLAQDELYADHLATWHTRDHFERRIGELLSSGSIGVPIWRGERCFQMRRLPDQEHAVLLVRDPGEPERVLIDPMALDPTGLTTLDTWQPSKEGDLLAYQVSEGGTEESTLRVIDVDGGQVVDGPIDRARYSPVAFLPGGRAYYYVRRLAPDLVPEDERQYHRRVYLHRLGSDPAEDVEIFGAGQDLRSYYGVGVSRDGGWLTVSVSTGTEPRNDLWIADISVAGSASAQEGFDPALTDPRWVPVTVGLDAQTGVHLGRDGRLYVSTDLDNPRGRFAVTDPRDPAPHTWQTLLAGSEQEQRVLADVAIADGEQLTEPLLLASWTRHAVSELTVHRVTGEPLEGPAGRVDLPGLGSLGGLVERPDGGPLIWFGYSDHVTPQHIHCYDARTGEVSLFAAPPGALPTGLPTGPTTGPSTGPIPGGSPTPIGGQIRTEQVTCHSADGTPVRLFVIRRHPPRDVALHPAPTILYGYGGFGVSLTPAYSAAILAWVEAGGVYAIASLRGGAEEGEAWHRAGMLGAKHHVFEDFEAAAEHLIAAGLTTPELLAISGGSNGGLLVGAALTRRPDLYRAVVCSAPLLDMVRYEQFGLGSTWNVEYGSADVPEQLAWLLGYSPYHHVRPGTRYPAVLFTVFDGDTRVDPMHARKLCAALQHATSGHPGTAPVLLRAEKDVGHGARALSRSVALSAETMAFLAHHTGLTPGTA